MADDLICQPFGRTDGVFTLRSSVCLTQEQWDAITPEELQAQQDFLWQVFRDNLNAPPDTDPDPPEEIIDPAPQE